MATGKKNVELERIKFSKVNLTYLKTGKLLSIKLSHNGLALRIWGPLPFT